jgi:chromosome segregation ATPase
LKSKVAKLKAVVQSQSQTVRDIMGERDSERAIGERLAAEKASLKEDLRKTADQFEALQARIRITRREVEDRTAVSPEDVLPIQAWRCHEFDSAIGAQIDRIAVNSLLQPASKLAQIYRVIHAHYAEQAKLNEKSGRVGTEELHRIEGIVNQLVIDLSVALSMGPATFDDLISRGWSDKVLQKLRENTQMINELKAMNHQFHALSQHIIAQFGDSPDLLARISEVSATLAKTRDALESKVARNRELTAQLRELREARSGEIDRLNAENHVLNGTIERLQASASPSVGNARKLKAELNTAKQARQEAETALSQRESALRTDHSRMVEELTQEHEHVQEQLKNRIVQLSADLAKASETISSQDRSLKMLKNGAGSQPNGANDTAAQVELLRSAKENAAAATEARAERQQLIETYESAIAEMRGELETYRAECDRVRTDLSDLELVARRLKKAMLKAKAKRTRAERELRARTEQFDHEMRANAARLKASAAPPESSADAAIQDFRSKLEREKRRIFAMAADEFHTLALCSPINDEDAYRSLLAKVRSELRRLTESDQVIRRLVGAKPRQTTDDAVAQCIVA